MNDSASNDPYDLGRFVLAQAGTYQQVIAELRAGRKRSHWMWFVFPQVEGLGFSPTSQRYAITSRAEAEGYLAHPVLGPRLRECTGLVSAQPGASIGDILGSPDDMKFNSSMTLFEAISRDPLYTAALAKFFDSRRDQATLDILATWQAEARG